MPSSKDSYEFICPSGLIADIEDQLDRDRCDVFAAEAGRRFGQEAIPIAWAMAEKAQTWKPDFDIGRFFRDVQSDIEKDEIIDLSDGRSSQFH